MNSQFAGGACVAAISIAALIATRNLDTGSLSEIGPGLFPKALAVILLCLSLAVVFTGVIGKRHEPLQPWRSRPIVFVLGAVVLFGLTVRTLGIAFAAPLSLLVAGFASTETRWLQLVLFVLVLTIFCTVLFRFVLGLPIPLAPWLIGY